MVQVLTVTGAAATAATTIDVWVTFDLGAITTMTITGSGFDDTITGSQTNDTIDGGNGNDTITVSEGTNSSQVEPATTPLRVVTIPIPSLVVLESMRSRAGLAMTLTALQVSHLQPTVTRLPATR